MNIAPHNGTDQTLERSPSFTLATALAWLGHDCSGHCPHSATDRHATVWFVRLPFPADLSWTRTLVEVDFTEPRLTAAQVRALLSQVNQCVRSDHIQVRERVRASAVLDHPVVADAE